ncbi:MAG TPA: O-antigen ligase family protein [Pyrinomonadaceae bacterium]|nr:O-antigen ligase family protein [Pyrinomonadaceae bacterium]
MTTSISTSESNELAPASMETRLAASRGYTSYRIRHTLASRFAFLIICLAIILSALAYGTVHAWSLAVFFIGAIVLLILWVADGWRLGTFRVSQNILQLPLIGLIVLGAIQLLPLRSAPVAPSVSVPLLHTLSLNPYATRFIVIEVIALLIYLAATLVFIDTPKRLRLIVRSITIFGFLLAIFGLTQSFTSGNRLYWVRDMAQSTAFGPFINRHHFAGYMELTIALPLGLIFTNAIEREKKFIYLFAAALMAIALIMTNSRGGIVSLIAEVLFLVSMMGFGRKHRKRKSHKKPRIQSAAAKTGLALAMLMALFLGVMMFGGEDAISRIVGSVNADDPTTGRTHFWSVTLDIIKNHPVLGTGLGAFGVVYTGYDTRNGQYRLEQAHNDYLQVLSDAGIVGAVLGLIFLAGLFRIGFARRDSPDRFRRGVATGAMAGCFAVLVHSFFDFTLHTTSNTLLFLILAALATMNGRVEEVHARRKKRRSEQTTTEVVEGETAQPALAG